MAKTVCWDVPDNLAAVLVKRNERRRGIARQLHTLLGDKVHKPTIAMRALAMYPKRYACSSWSGHSSRLLVLDGGSSQ